MTEAEWLVSKDPQAMLSTLGSKVTSRKLRLIAVACCRVWWNRLNDWRCRLAVEVAERYADRTATDEELAEARERIKSARKYSSTELARQVTKLGDAAAAVGTLHMARFVTAMDASDRKLNDVVLPSEADAIRCLFGLQPFHPVAFNPSWRSSTALAIAEGVYADRAFHRLPILADALQDAGCEDADILGHLRGDGPHVKGCWALDLVLGKE